jgi:hypothetical protein
VACITCPYLENYELLWDDRAASGRICVKLWCCAGPELQIRDGHAVVLDEYFENPNDLCERAEMLRLELAIENPAEAGFHVLRG